MMLKEKEDDRGRAGGRRGVEAGREEQNKNAAENPARRKNKKKNAAENPARPSSFAEGNGEERRRQMDDMGG